jgi:autotransporter-associated beta strand protein
VAGGTVVVNSDVTLAAYTGTNAASKATGTLNINGGSVTVGGNIVTTDSANATATVTLNGGTLDMTGGNINVDAFNAQTGILRNVGQIFNGDGITAAPLTKTGAGALELQGANTFTGGATISEGSFYVSGSLTTGAVTAASNTTFGGNALLNGSLSLADNSTLKIDLGGLVAGSTGYDQITMADTAGSVSLGSNVTLSLSLGFTPDTSVDTFYYILNRADAGTYANTFAGLAEGTVIDLGNGVTGKLTYLANWTGNAATSSITGGNDVAITIPEPGTVVSLLGGLGALRGLGRFRRRAYRA